MGSAAKDMSLSASYWDSATDEELMVAIAAGDLSPLDELHKRFASGLRSTMARIVPEMPIAVIDDLTQDVFVEVCQAVENYEERNRLRSWLFGIAVRKALAWRRRTWLRRRIRNDHGTECAGIALSRPPSPASQAGARMLVEKLLAKLPDNQREALWLSAGCGFSGEEIAEMLGTTPGTIFTRLHRARKKLSDWMTKAGVDPHFDAEDS